MYCTPGHDDGGVLISGECETASAYKRKRKEEREGKYHSKGAIIRRMNSTAYTNADHSSRQIIGRL